MSEKASTDTSLSCCAEVSSICSVCNSEFSYLKPAGRRGANKKVCDKCRESGFVHAMHKHTCINCNSDFESVRRIQKYCSQSCAKEATGNERRIWPTKADSRRHAEHVRRARIKSSEHEKFTYKEIFERDGHVCGICGKKTDSSPNANRNNRPSLDHIVPLAVGGLHARKNVQCAHWICNSRKSWVGGGQMKLVLSEGMHV